MRVRNWLPLLGVAAVAIAAVMPFTRHPPAPGLLVSAVVAAGSGTTYVLWGRAPRPLGSVLYAACVAAFLVLCALTGDAAIGFFVAASFAVLHQPIRVHLIVLVIATTVLNVVQLATGSETPLTLLATDAGIVFFAAVGGLAVSERRQRERADRLLVELDEARRNEQEAALMAERAAMARDVHDVLAHTLSGLAIQLEAARVLAADSAPELQDSVATAHRLAREGLREARVAVSALRDEQAAAGSVADLVAEHRLMCRAPIAFHESGTPHSVPPRVAMTIYRVVQEALSNVRKHAPTAPCTVDLAWLPERVTVAIRNPAPAPSGTPGWGIAGMRERAAAHDAELTAEWADGSFVVRLDVPLGGRVPALS